MWQIINETLSVRFCSIATQTPDKNGNLKLHIITTKIAQPIWQAAAWFLERTMPDEFGRNRPLKDDDSASQLADNIHSAIEVVEEKVKKIKRRKKP